MPVSASKATGSVAKILPRAKPQIYTPGPVKLSNAQRVKFGLKPNPSSAQKIKTYKGK